MKTSQNTADVPRVGSTGGSADFALLGLLADIRAAVGDPNGKLMQEELVAHCRKLRSDLNLAMAANSDVRRIADEREAFRQSLRDVLPIIEAMRYTAGLGKNQAARFEKAKALLAAYDSGVSPNVKDEPRLRPARLLLRRRRDGRRRWLL